MHWSFLSLALSLSLAQSPEPGGVTLMSVDSALYKELQPDALAWRRAVVGRDVAKVVSYAPDEFKPGLLKAFRERFSAEYRSVFGPARSSLRGGLQSRTQPVMFEHPHDSGDQPVTITVCYTTLEERRTDWPTEEGALKEKAVKSGIPCQVFRRGRTAWITMIEPLVH
jgi:hypothetical protein